MKITTLELTARDPIVSRDGRPFGAGQGNRMRSVDWPLPSVIAGSLRTALGKTAGKDFSLETAAELQQVSVSGVFPVANNQLYLPSPQDCVVHPSRGPLPAMPIEINDGGCDLPHPGLRPVMFDQPTDEDDFKPKAPPAWWPIADYVKWLSGSSVTLNEDFLLAPEQEDRTHVKMDADAGVGSDGELFTTTGLALDHLRRYFDSKWSETQCRSFADRYAEIRLATRVASDGWCAEQVSNLDGHFPTGGERRLIHWKANANAAIWSCPDTIRSALQRAEKVRMVLTTPSIFRDGWKPGWLNDELVGSPPGSDVQLQLVGTTIQRWRAISGWSLARINDQGQLDPHGRPGPKPIRRMVPAGGVYFFSVVSGNSASLSDCWQRSVCDEEQNQRDGFGLATWGIW